MNGCQIALERLSITGLRIEYFAKRHIQKISESYGKVSIVGRSLVSFLACNSWIMKKLRRSAILLPFSYSWSRRLNSSLFRTFLRSWFGNFKENMSGNRKELQFREFTRRLTPPSCGRNTPNFLDIVRINNVFKIS